MQQLPSHDQYGVQQKVEATNVKVEFAATVLAQRDKLGRNKWQFWPLRSSKRAATKIISWGPGRLGAIRAFSMTRLRKLARDLRPVTRRELASCHQRVQAVLRVTGKEGLHLALLEKLLDEIK